MAEICPILWNGFAIDSRGNVFSCCHMMPPAMGNIYNTPLCDLTNSPNILERRKESLRNQLKCFSDCNLITYKKQPIEPTNEYADYSRMTYLHLNFGYFCNIHCIMCKIHLNRKNNESILDPDTLIKNIDLTTFEEIVIQGGEPLFIPECKVYLEYLGKIRKKYVLLTNGILIDNETAQQLARHAARVVISINAASKEIHEYVNRGSDFETVKDSIQRMRMARDAEHTDLVLHGRMTITTYSLHEIPRFIQSYKEIGFDKINFGYDRATVPAYLKKNPDFRKKLAKETQDALKHAELSDINPLRLEQLGLIPEGFSGKQRGF